MKGKSGHRHACLTRRVGAGAARRSTRRGLLAALVVGALASRELLAQAKPPVVIGWLHPATRTTNPRSLETFKDGLKALGWNEGSSYLLEERWADGQVDRLPALAAELNARRPAVIVAVQSLAAIAAARAAPGVPVVQASGSSPVYTKLAASLARPGGMVTGVTNVFSEVSAKYFELLLAAAPDVKRVGVLVESAVFPRRDYVEHARRAGTQYSVEVRTGEVASSENIDTVMARFAREGVQGLVVLPGGLFNSERHRIVKPALEKRWPVVGTPTFAEQGALLGYGAVSSVLYRRASWYVDRILKGAKPGDLPIEQPTKFELVVNLKTAKTSESHSLSRYSCARTG